MRKWLKLPLFLLPCFILIVRFIVPNYLYSFGIDFETFGHTSYVTSSSLIRDGKLIDLQTYPYYYPLYYILLEILFDATFNISNVSYVTSYIPIIITLSNFILILIHITISIFLFLVGVKLNLIKNSFNSFLLTWTLFVSSDISFNIFGCPQGVAFLFFLIVLEKTFSSKIDVNRIIILGIIEIAITLVHPIYNSIVLSLLFIISFMFLTLNRVKKTFYLNLFIIFIILIIANSAWLALHATSYALLIKNTIEGFFYPSTQFIVASLPLPTVSYSALAYKMARITNITILAILSLIGFIRTVQSYINGKISLGRIFQGVFLIFTISILLMFLEFLLIPSLSIIIVKPYVYLGFSMILNSEYTYSTSLKNRTRRNLFTITLLILAVTSIIYTLLYYKSYPFYGNIDAQKSFCYSRFIEHFSNFNSVKDIFVFHQQEGVDLVSISLFKKNLFLFDPRNIYGNTLDANSLKALSLNANRVLLYYRSESTYLTFSELFPISSKIFDMNHYGLLVVE